VWVTSSAAKALTPTAVALGNFDGHRWASTGSEPILNTEHNIYATVVTFNPHPQEFFLPGNAVLC